jgi:hypothetical protein
MLAERDLAAETRGDVGAALALYSDDAIVQYGGLRWIPCVGKEAIHEEVERRIAAKNEWKIICKKRVRQCRGRSDRAQDRLYRSVRR